MRLRLQAHISALLKWEEVAQSPPPLPKPISPLQTSEGKLYDRVCGNRGKVTFFNSAFTIDDGRLRGGSERAQIHILLHELGHGLGAAGFLHDHNDAVAGKANDKLIRENCKMTLDHFRN